jgi:hypothetical protein
MKKVKMNSDALVFIAILACLLLAYAVLFDSWPLPKYRIEQGVYDNWFYGLRYETKVYSRDDVLKLWSDNLSDSVKCYQYSEAKKFVARLKRIDNKKCK